MSDPSTDPAKQPSDAIRIVTLLFVVAAAGVAYYAIDEYLRTAPARDRILSQIAVVKSGRYDIIGIVNLGKYSDWDQFIKLKGDLAEVDHYGLSIAYSDGVNGALKQIAGEPGLRLLELIETDISDVGMEIIASLPDLEQLDIYLGNITDAGLEKLRSSPRLESLTLCMPEANQVTVPAIGALPCLRELTLYFEGDAGANWSYEDLVQLEQATSLRELILIAENQSPDEIERLRARLPGCNITVKPLP